MAEPCEIDIQGLKLRSFTYGTMLLAHMLDLPLVRGEDVEDFTEAELHRQICTFAWMQSVEPSEVTRAIREQSVESRVLEFAMEKMTPPRITAIMDHLAVIAAMVQAATVRAESRHPVGKEDDPPGKS
jgi:hypothetical protein